MAATTYVLLTEAALFELPKNIKGCVAENIRLFCSIVFQVSIIKCFSWWKLLVCNMLGRHTLGIIVACNNVAQSMIAVLPWRCRDFKETEVSVMSIWTNLSLLPVTVAYNNVVNTDDYTMPLGKLPLFMKTALHWHLSTTGHRSSSLEQRIHQNSSLLSYIFVISTHDHSIFILASSLGA